MESHRLARSAGDGSPKILTTGVLATWRGHRVQGQSRTTDTNLDFAFVENAHVFVDTTLGGDAALAPLSAPPPLILFYPLIDWIDFKAIDFVFLTSFALPGVIMAFKLSRQYLFISCLECDVRQIYFKLRCIIESFRSNKIMFRLSVV